MKNIERNTMHKSKTLIAFDNAFETVMSSARLLGAERVDISCALNRVLADDVASDTEMPPFNKSAMDGFACRRRDLADTLTVIETIPAGYMPKKVIGARHCAKIMTGGVVPVGADCVIMVEYTESVGTDRIRFTAGGTEDNICLAGEDIRKGQVVLRAGEIIKPQHIAVLASVGCVNPLVALRPRLGVIATGNELVDPAEKPDSCQIRNSNGFQLAAQAAHAGAIPTNYGIAADTREAIDAMVKKAMAENDVVILSGGVSMGDYDFVRGVLRKNNVKLLFEKVAVKPGKPTVFGASDSAYCFGLPGNPVSTFILFELLVKPFLFKMAGHNFKPVIIRRRLERTITRKKTNRDSWLPVMFTETPPDGLKNGKAAIIEYHGSAHINALCEADGLICIPAGVAEIKEGTDVAVRQI